MGEVFNYDNYPLADILLNELYLINKNTDIDKLKNKVYLECVNELKYALVRPEQIIYLDFDLKIDKFGDYIEVMPNNIITGLWFCGLYPLEVEDVIESKKFDIGEGYYTFDIDRKKIKYHKNK